ncbi:MAG TPA: C-type lectin domain-containing protein [Kofleriaceae bacterium]
MARRVVVLLLVACCRFGFDKGQLRDGEVVGEAVVPLDAEIAVDAMLVVDAPLLVLDAGQCPPTYTKIGASCYRIGGNVPRWIDGELACEADGVGAHLATINDAAEASLVAAALPEPDYWVGMTDRITEGQYRNVTGELAPYLVWVPGEPTSSDCAQFDEDALFHVSTCDTSDDYLCEFDGRPAVAGAY